METHHPLYTSPFYCSPFFFKMHSYFLIGIEVNGEELYNINNHLFMLIGRLAFSKKECHRFLVCGTLYQSFLFF